MKNIEVLIQYSLMDNLNPFLYRKNGFQMHIIRNKLMVVPNNTPVIPYMLPNMIEQDMLIIASIIDDHTS